VVNAGVSGDTSAGGLSRLDWALDGDVRVLIVALGGNDALRGLPVDQLKRNLAQIIERAQARGIAVVLAGMEAPPNFGRPYLVAIVGPSGSGKSTLLGLIAGLDAPSSGQVLIDGVDITRLNEDALARLRGEKIGFVFQFFHLIPSLTAYENVAVPMEIAGVPNPRGRAEMLMEEVGLTGRAHHYPSQLSGGEQQRVALARALANQ